MCHGRNNAFGRGVWQRILHGCVLHMFGIIERTNHGCQPTSMSLGPPAFFVSYHTPATWKLLNERRIQILMLKSGSHPVDFMLRDALPCRFVPPVCDRFADLGGYLKSLGIIQFKIPG